jgi:hypothetical protein
MPSSNPQAQILKSKVVSTVGQEVAAALFEGPPNDVLILLNETSSAPNARRVLSGEVKFADGSVVLCRAPSAQFEETFDWYIQTQLIKLIPNAIFSRFKISENQCAQQPNSDLVAIRRAALLNSESTGLGIADAISTRRLSLFLVIAHQPYELQKSNVLATKHKNRKQLLAGTLDGFSYVLIPTAPSSTVCIDSSRGHNVAVALLEEIRSSTVFETRWPLTPTLIQDSADELFIRAKRQHCGFVAGDAPLMTLMARGFERDGTPFTVGSIVLNSARVDEIAKNVAETERVALLEQQLSQKAEKQRMERTREEEKSRREEAERRAQQERVLNDEQRRLAEIRRRNDERVRIEEIERSRKIVASRARTLVDSLEAQLRGHISSVAKEVADRRRRATLGEIPSEAQIRRERALFEEERITGSFPHWAAWFADRTKEEWEFGTPQASLEDYGLAQWKTRTIEALSVKVEFPMLNRTIGDRKRFCVVFAWINDEEFSFRRESETFDCASYAKSFQTWATRNSFVSQWKVALQ